MIGGSNDETTSPHKLLLTDTKVLSLCKAFGNISSANIKLWKTQLSKMLQSGGFIDPLSRFLLKKGEKFVWNAATKLAKNVQIYFVDQGINTLCKFAQNKCSGKTLTNNGIKGIIKEVRSLGNRGIFLKGTNGNAINQRERFLSLLIRACLPLLKNVLTPLAKNVLLQLGVAAAASATDAVIQIKFMDQA